MTARQRNTKMLQLQQHLSARDARRLTSCSAALQQLQAATAKPHPCYFNAAEKTRIDMMDALTRECLERERDALVRKARYIAANDTSLWKIKEAADDFIFSATAAERAGKRQALEALMGAYFPQTSIAGYASSLAAMPLKVRPIDVVQGGIFVAEVEGCEGVDRIVGHYDFALDNEARLNHRYGCQGLEAATAVYLRPVADIVSWETEASGLKTPKEWAAYEKREQMYRHGINKVLNGGGASTFLSLCMSKTLCVRCGGGGHTSAVCRAVYKAAWAGGDIIAINSA